MIITECLPARHLWIAVPAYTGQVSADTSHSLNEAATLLAQAGVKVSFDYVCGCCYLDHTRNMLATSFMRSDATDLLFVDADLGFSPEAALRIAYAKKPFIAGIYPKKKDEVTFPVEFDQAELWADAEGHIEASMVPTGFLRINRAVFEAFPAETYDSDDKPGWFNYFQNGVRGGRYVGEDVKFCRDWRAKGGKIHIIPDLLFSHNGMKGWKANWAEWQRAQCA